MRTRSTRRLLAAAAVAAFAAVGLPATAQAAEGDKNDRIVEQWYVDVLQRPANQTQAQSGRQFWTDRLNAGDTRLRILESIESSAEFADNTVGGYYEEYLGRPANDRGADYWKNGVRADMEPEWVEQNILASAEYAGRSGQNPVDEWYSDILGRQGSNSANSGEEEYWTGRAKAVGPLAAVREIWYSGEAVDRRVRSAYYDLLGREQVSLQEVDYWYNTAVDGRLAFRNQIATSDEYAARAQTR
ncbi:hypothetical protein [Quadrisphaera sp. INWT6]|uniref:hypothetical protein n=1 Tax=Quadrisphaera sp. INWT6 TaxID=2596917 RepID=UPI00189267EF|nr:hypothetical protein [Quadrisphaera sp. INWT6]MBF5081503.1 hypothetical protein [Quadrisphaera sp. INWT6]